jgi:hypothetical protein
MKNRADGVGVVLGLPGEGVGQPGEPTNTHANRRFDRSTPDRLAESFCHVGHERLRALAGPRANEQRDHELGVGIQGRVGPNVTVPVLLGVLLLRPDERPQLVGLDMLGGQVSEHVVLMEGIELADLDQ